MLAGPIFAREVLTTPRRPKHYIFRAAYVGLLFATGAATAQPADTLPDRAGALVASSPTFVFYSDPVTNLHDFLVWSARSQEPVEPAPDCLASLSTEQRAAFEKSKPQH